MRASVGTPARAAATGTTLAALALTAASLAQAQTRLPTVDRFTATTVSMTPADIELRIDLREWSDEASRSAVVAALAGESDESDETDIETALAEVPTLGYVWRSDSGVGYSIKYAHRVDTAQGERVTFVTDKRLGVYDFEPWAVDGSAELPVLDYSVIELYLPDNGNGMGTISLGAEVRLDEENGLVSLETPEGAPRLLTDARLESKPYAAKGK